MKTSLALQALLLLATASLHAAAAPSPSPAQLEFFEKNIRPVLSQKCYKCHSASEKVKGGLTLDTREGLRAGGDSGQAVVPGKPNDSLLLKAIQWTDPDLQMPPKREGGKLSDTEIANIQQWIAMGAPDQRETAAGSNPATGPVAVNAKDFWAGTPPVKPAVPAVKNTAWPRTEIDRFILASLETKGLKPVQDSDPRALLRKVHCDLIGLPPSVDTVDWFAKECAKGPAARQAAFTAIVDRLLQSPRFGERWGRHWLDVVRFAESTGREQNNLMPTAWRYRDYAIASFNADKPYDRFIREQIAGDLLPAKTAAQRDEQLIATAFLALGTKSLVEKKPLQFEMDMVDEQIDTASRAILGLTVACARCHNHKYDPVSMRDYYALAGVFRSTKTYYGANDKRGRNTSGFLSLSTAAQPSPAAPANPVPQSKSAPAVPKPSAAPSNSNKSAASPTIINMAGAPAKPALNPASRKGLTPEEIRKMRILAKKAAIQSQLVTYTPQQLMGKTIGVTEATPMDSVIYVRGEITQPGERVPRGFVKALSTTDTPSIPPNCSGRLQLAQWLTSPKNPLTARVMVNRLWQNMLGEGLVRTPDNFGTTGERPTHPELLDYLATRFMAEGWSVKRLLREIALSRVYQLSTIEEPANRAVDPDNRYCWHANARRLDAETIRDSLLTASGLMDLKPPQGSMVASAGMVPATRFANTFTNAQFHYRSVYLPIVRDFVPSCLEVFDFAEPTLVVASRGTTNVPSQALYMMNNPFVQEQAEALAKRFANHPQEERLALIYRAALCRPPTTAERDRARDLLAAFPADQSQMAFTVLCQALFASAEFRYLADTLPSNHESESSL